MSLSSFLLLSLYFALPSVEITFAMSFNNSSSNIAANPMACGNTVAVPALATPCNPSFHQLYLGIFNLFTADDL